MSRIDGEINLEVNKQRLVGSIDRAVRSYERSGKRLDKTPLGRFPTLSKDVSEFDKSLEAANARVVAFGASAGAIFLVQKAFRSLISEVVNVQKAMTDVQVILNETPKGLQNIQKQLFAIAKDTGQTFNTVAQGAVELARQGLSAEQTVSRLRDALVLVRISGLEVDKAVSALTATINGFAREVLSTTDILNKMVVVESSFAVSSQDLAEAITRAASSASEANVAFDEFIAVVTAAQQITARGGPVIGNGLKTIFTRVQRPQVIEQLREYNIQVAEASSGIDTLKAVAQEFDNLTSAQQSQVSELIGSVFQINVLQAILRDLRAEYSIYEGALQKSVTATDEAIKRNEQLNQTLTALFNTTAEGTRELAAGIGDLGLEKAFSGILTAVNSLLGGINNLIENSTVFRGIIKGIGELISGPALVTVGVIVGRLFYETAKFAAQSFGTFLKIGSELEKQAHRQQVVNALLATGSQEYVRQFQAASTLEQRERAINLLLAERIGLQRGLSGQYAAQVSSAAINPSVLGRQTGFIGRQRFNQLPTAASGFTASKQRERGDIRKGVGGASSSASPVTVSGFNFGGGLRGPIVANSEEFLVRNFAGGADAILNKNMVSSMGLPKGAKSLGVPNFALGGVSDATLRKLLRNQKWALNANERLALQEAGINPDAVRPVNTKGLTRTQASIAEREALFGIKKEMRQTLRGARATRAPRATSSRVSPSVAGAQASVTGARISDRFPEPSGLGGAKDDISALVNKIRFSERVEDVVQGRANISEADLSKVKEERSLFILRNEIRKRKGLESLKGMDDKGLREVLDSNAELQTEIAKKLDANLQETLFDPSERNKQMRFQAGLEERLTRAGLVKDRELRGMFGFISSKKIRDVSRDIFETPINEIETEAQKNQRELARRDFVTKKRLEVAARRQSVALMASFALPFVSGVLRESLGDEGVGGILGSGITKAAVGAQLGLVAGGGAIGALAGAGVGFTAGTVGGIIDQSTKSADRLTKQLQEMSGVMQNNVNTATTYTQTQAKLNDLLASGTFRQSEVNNLMNEMTRLFSQIEDADLRLSLAAAGGDPGRQQRVIGEFQGREERKVAAQAAAVQLATAREAQGFFFRANEFFSKNLGIGSASRVGSISSSEEIRSAARTLAQSIDITSEDVASQMAELNKEFKSSEFSVDFFRNTLKSLGVEQKTISEITDGSSDNLNTLNRLLADFFELTGENRELLLAFQNQTRLTLAYGNFNKELKNLASTILSVSAVSSEFDKNMVQFRGSLNKLILETEVSGGMMGRSRAREVGLRLSQQDLAEQDRVRQAQENLKANERIIEIMTENRIRDSKLGESIVDQLSSGLNPLSAIKLLLEADFETANSAKESLNELNRDIKKQNAISQGQLELQKRMLEINTKAQEIQQRISDRAGMFGGDVVGGSGDMINWREMQDAIFQIGRFETISARRIRPSGLQNIQRQDEAFLQEQISSTRGLRKLTEVFGQTIIDEVFGEDALKQTESQARRSLLLGQAPSFLRSAAQSGTESSIFRGNIPAEMERIFARQDLSEEERIGAIRTLIQGERDRMLSNPLLAGRERDSFDAYTQNLLNAVNLLSKSLDATDPEADKDVLQELRELSRSSFESQNNFQERFIKALEDSYATLHSDLKNEIFKNVENVNKERAEAERIAEVSARRRVADNLAAGVGARVDATKLEGKDREGLIYKIMERRDRGLGVGSSFARTGIEEIDKGMSSVVLSNLEFSLAQAIKKSSNLGQARGEFFKRANIGNIQAEGFSTEELKELLWNSIVRNIVDALGSDVLSPSSMRDIASDMRSKALETQSAKIEELSSTTEQREVEDLKKEIKQLEITISTLNDLIKRGGTPIETGANGIFSAKMREKMESGMNPKVIPSFNFGFGKRGPAVMNQSELLLRSSQGDSVIPSFAGGTGSIRIGGKTINIEEFLSSRKETPLAPQLPSGTGVIDIGGRKIDVSSSPKLGAGQMSVSRRPSFTPEEHRRTNLSQRRAALQGHLNEGISNSPASPTAQTKEEIKEGVIEGVKEGVQEINKSIEQLSFKIEQTIGLSVNVTDPSKRLELELVLRNALQEYFDEKFNELKTRVDNLESENNGGSKLPPRAVQTRR